jgi:hypothetical protein
VTRCSLVDGVNPEYEGNMFLQNLLPMCQAAQRDVSQNTSYMSTFTHMFIHSTSSPEVSIILKPGITNICDITWRMVA